jgi:hypothetical protein
MEVLIKLQSHDDLDVRRQSVTVISSLFPNGKNSQLFYFINIYKNVIN